MVFVCGNDSDAKREVEKLIVDFGWKQNNIIELGDITAARGTEMMLPVWRRLWRSIGHANFNFHIVANFGAW